MTKTMLGAKVRSVLSRREKPMTPPGEAMVLAALRAAGSKGLTVGELAEVLNEHKATVWSRVSKLARTGKVVTAGVVRVPHHSPAQVWRLA